MFKGQNRHDEIREKLNDAISDIFMEYQTQYQMWGDEEPIYSMALDEKEDEIVDIVQTMLQAQFDGMPKTLSYYFNPLANNYIIPVSKMTDNIMIEIMETIRNNPLIYSYKDGKISIEDGYLLMMIYEDDEECYCLTSWLV